MTQSRNVFIICATVMFCIVVATAIGIERITNDANAALGIITILFAFYGTSLASLASLIKGEAVKQNTEQIVQNTEKILNGDMQAKIEEGVANVLKRWLTDENSRPRAPKHRDRT